MTVRELREELNRLDGAMEVKVDGFAITKVTREPDEGGHPGYLDITGL